MKRYYNLELSYDGQNYFGWQKQKDFETVQGTLEATIKEMIGSNFIKSIGSSRTDTGVHALANICFLQLPTEYTPQALMDNLNNNLPKDIRVTRCERTYKQFKVIYFAKKKSYFYLFKNLPQEIDSDYFTNITTPLDINKMKEAAKSFEGLHNFSNFCYKASPNSEKNKEIFTCKIIENQDILTGHNREGSYALIVEGSGFLKQMIRIIMGTLFNIGMGKVEIKDIEEAFSTTDFRKTGFITPGGGLYLKEIEFIRDPFKGHSVNS
ncbi:tRNA pseudouridine(38-40) synthase TruA [Halobacteriovorax sp. HLS]|uniref:tRNA pseudouridine(38-40) synthase TruA n=1 Tax=Halobacteriovorax sp. HLS TaxID=2234000 RepID=UPI000FDA80DD|nr:tRNA pseudouridine(38-40) synthase TruA [Halobacteriovorax sp. HLS]